MDELEFVCWYRAKNPLGECVINSIGRKFCVRISLNLELLHQSSKENVELFLSQSLAKADSLPNTKRSHSFIHDKLAFGIQEPVWIEQVRILEVIRIVHDVVEAAQDSCSFRHNKVTNGDVSSGAVRKTCWSKDSSSEALQQDSIGVVKIRFVIQAWESVAANHL